jgi:hypothetical protein
MDNNSSEKQQPLNVKSDSPKSFAWRIFLQAGEKGKGFFL